jgi:hypothetical protein
MAEAWLATAHGLPQRSMTARRVQQYASQMVRGQWRVTHQAIAIDPEGVLIDGQHRLAAVVLSRQTVRMPVAFDVPRESFDVLDTGFARTTASILHIAGVGDANALAAAARNLLMYREIDGTRRAPGADIRNQFSSRDVLDFVESDEGQVLRANLYVARQIAASLSKYGTRSWIAAALTLIDVSGPNPTQRNTFVEKWETGDMVAVGSPIHTLRKWLLSEHGYARQSHQYRGAVGMGATIRAWNAYAHGHDLSQIRIRPTKERWPVVGREDIDEADADTAPPTLDLPDADDAESVA